MIFQNSFRRFTAKTVHKVHRVSIRLLAPNSLIATTGHHSYIFVQINKPTLTQHYHSEPIVYITVHSSCGTFCGCDKHIITFIYYYNTIQSSFTALKPSGFCLSISTSLNTWQPWMLMCVHSFAFSRMALVGIAHFQPFQAGFSLPKYTFTFYACFFKADSLCLSELNVSSSGCTIVI